MKFYWVTRGTVCGLNNILIARTGYTGEDGFEIYVPADEATSARVWNEILEAGKEFGVVPCGLGRATRCAWKASCRSTATKFPTPSMSGKLDSIASARWRSRSSSAGRRWRRRKPQA